MREAFRGERYCFLDMAAFLFHVATLSRSLLTTEHYGYLLAICNVLALNVRCCSYDQACNAQLVIYVLTLTSSVHGSAHFSCDALKYLLCSAFKNVFLAVSFLLTRATGGTTETEKVLQILENLNLDLFLFSNKP